MQAFVPYPLGSNAKRGNTCSFASISSEQLAFGLKACRFAVFNYTMDKLQMSMDGWSQIVT